MATLFGFDAKSIQNFIAEGNRLVDLALGSELIERLCQDDLTNALKACGAQSKKNPENKLEIDDEDIKFFSRAGGHFRLEIKDKIKADKFKKIWILVVQSLAPNLSFAFDYVDYVDTASGNDERNLRKKLEHQHNLPSVKLPLAPPIAIRAQRTGGAASVFDDNVNKNDNLYGGSEAIGASAARRRALRKLIGAGKGELEKKYELEENVKTLYFNVYPNKEIKSFIYDADAMTDARDTNVLAYIYADGSKLGEIFMTLSNARDECKDDGSKNLISDALKSFSKGLDLATQRAARIALWGRVPEVIEQLNKKTNKSDLVINARPIVLGGDDLSIILPAKDGLKFAEDYVKQFENEAKEIFDILKNNIKNQNIKLPPKLTCGAGIAYVPSHYPAHKALKLAETMCSWAKEKVNRKFSCIAFHRVTTSEPEHYKNVLENELEIEDRILTAGPYLLDEANNGFASLDQVRSLEKLASDLPRGTMREIFTLAHSSKNAANRRFKRAIEIAHGSRHDIRNKAMKGFLNILQEMGADENSVWIKENRTPIGDIHTISSVESRITNERDENGEGA